MTTVTLVADIGIGDNTYRVLREGDSMTTSGGIDCYSHVASVAEADVADEVAAIEERYACTLIEADPK